MLPTARQQKLVQQSRFLHFEYQPYLSLYLEKRKKRAKIKNLATIEA